MRLPLIAPSDLTSEQRPIYEDMRAGIAEHFRGFSSIADSGALMGPWFLLAFAAETSARSGDPRHWCQIPSSL